MSVVNALLFLVIFSTPRLSTEKLKMLLGFRDGPSKKRVAFALEFALELRTASELHEVLR